MRICQSVIKVDHIPVDIFREHKARWNLSDIASIWVVISMSIVSGMNVTRTRRRIRLKPHVDGPSRIAKSLRIYPDSRGLGRSHARYEC